jgi:hypothetical protein
MKIDLLGEDHFSVIGTLSTLTFRSVQHHDVAAALAYGERAWRGAQKLPSDNPSVSYAAITYAQALMADGRAKEARPLIETALAQRRAALAPDSPLLANTESVYALAEAEDGDVAAGEALGRSAYERLVAHAGEANALTQLAKTRLAEIVALGRADPHEMAERERSRARF